MRWPPANAGRVAGVQYGRVALIAPDSGLENIEAEVRSLSAALQGASVRALRNGVTTKDVMDLLTEQAWDVIWFACHGTRDGVQLSDALLSTAMIIQIVRNSGAKLVVLNTCDSEQIAGWVHMQTEASVIATISEVSDASAFVTGTLLARSLAQGLSPAQAFARARPGEVGLAQRWRIFERGYSPGQDIAKWMELMGIAMSPVTQTLEQVNERLEKLEQVNERLEKLELRPHLETKRRLVWFIGFLFMVSGEVLLIDGAQRALLLEWRFAAGLFVVLWTIGVGLVAYGFNFIGDSR